MQVGNTYAMDSDESVEVTYPKNLPEKVLINAFNILEHILHV